MDLKPWALAVQVGVGALTISGPLVGQLLFVSHCVLLLVNSPIPECRVHQVTATLNKDSLIVSLVVYIPQARLRETSGINLVMCSLYPKTLIFKSCPVSIDNTNLGRTF